MFLFIHLSNYLGVASLGPRVRLRAPSLSHSNVSVVGGIFQIK